MYSNKISILHNTRAFRLEADRARVCEFTDNIGEKQKEKVWSCFLERIPAALIDLRPLLFLTIVQVIVLRTIQVSMQLLNWMILVYWLGRGRRGRRADRAVHFSIRAHSEQKATVISSDLIVKHSGYKCDFVPSSCTTSVIWATSEWLQPLQDE